MTDTASPPEQGSGAAEPCAPAKMPNLDDVTDLNAALTDLQGELLKFECDLPCRFTFKVYGFPFVAVIDDVEGQNRLRLIGDVGTVPFSAEDAAARERILKLIGWGEASDQCRFSCSSSGRLAFLGETEVPQPLTGRNVVTALVKYILRTRAYFFLVAEQRMGKPASNAIN